MSRTLWRVVVVGAVAGLVVAGSPAVADRVKEPIVIGHRGASALRPEHTLGAYRMAISLGADYIEPDVVATKDRRLVARHDNWLADSTDVESHPEFTDRRRTKIVDGVTRTDWFTEDFTLAELKTLRTEERIPAIRPDSAVFNGLEAIPTLDEVLALARKHNVGVYPETKHPTYFDELGLSMEEPLLATLARYGFDSPRDKVFIQSFETANLRDLRRRTRIRLIQLINSSGAPYDFVAAGDPRTYANLITPEGLRWIASYAHGIGPSTTWIVPVDAAGNIGEPTTLVRDAQRLRLAVHTWTVRNENEFLPADFRQGNPSAPNYRQATGDIGGWLSLLYRLGVDGVFCDDPSAGVSVRARFFKS
jgi:glycerophosphoryl diester phosphodiesterase